jgi:hypothetical protein
VILIDTEQGPREPWTILVRAADHLQYNSPIEGHTTVVLGRLKPLADELRMEALRTPWLERKE